MTYTPPPRISAEDMLKTLDLYIRYQNTNVVGEKLGIKGPAVRRRLRSLGIKLRPQGYSNIPVEHLNESDQIMEIREDLRREIEKEKAFPSFRKDPMSLPPDIALETLELYLEHQSAFIVASRLGVNQTTILRRLKGLGVVVRPSGDKRASVRDLNNMVEIEATIARLKAEILNFRSDDK